jgi:hypothetical protein
MNATFISALLLLMLSGQAQADSWEQTNTSGGRIVLTDRQCDEGKYKNLLEAYAYTSTGTMEQGCWGPLDGKVHISWNQGKRSVYSMDGFVPGRENKRPNAKPTGNM